MSKQTIRFAAALLAGAAGLGIAGAPVANAAGTSYCSASTCSLSNSASTSQIYFEMPRGTAVSMICYTDAQQWNGTNRWFKVNSQYGRGFMIATQVSYQTRVGRC